MVNKFSIVTISYNAALCIEKTIHSVEAQEFLPYEYVFIDGGSNDNTNELIAEAEIRLIEKKIKVVHISEADEGISDAFNKGIRQSTGEVVVILNAGDEMLPGTLKLLHEKFEDKTDVLYGNVVWHDENTDREHVRKSDTNLQKLLYHMHIMHPATYVRKSAYEKYGYFNLDYKFSMDKELLYRFYKKDAVFQYVDHSFTKFISGGKSDSINKNALKEGERMALSYGEPRLKVKLITIKKILFYYGAHAVRKVLKR